MVQEGKVRRGRRGARLAAAVVLAGALAGGCRPPAPLQQGARVSRCTPGHSAARAGLHPGDVAVSWRSGRWSGPVRSPLDVWAAELVQAPRRPVVLRVVRGGREREIVIANGLWGVTWEGVFPASLGREAAIARSLEEAGRHREAAGAWTGLAKRADLDSGLRSWAWLRAGVALHLEDGGVGAGVCYDRAGELANMPLAGALVREVAARLLEKAGRRREAWQLSVDAAARCRGGGGGEALLAQALLGRALWSRRGDAEAAEEALRLFHELGPGSLEAAKARLAAAIAAHHRGDLARARAGYGEVLGMVRRRDPGNGLAVGTLANVALAQMGGGDLEGARLTCLEALAAGRKDGADPLTLVYLENFLGLAAKRAGRFQEARRWYEAALERIRRLRPGGEEEAGLLNNLGNVAMHQRDLAGAERYHRQAYRLRHALDPGGPGVASSLNNLGRVALRRGRLEQAGRFLERAAAIKRRLGPGTPWLAATLGGLGELALLQGRLKEAGERYRETLEIRRRVLPGGVGEAEALAGLGRVAAVQGRRAEAERLWRRAIELVEAQRNGVGLSEEERASFGAMFHWLYRRMACLKAKEGRALQAFVLLERDRARELRAAVGLRLSETLPAELHARWRRHLGEVRRVQRRLAVSAANGPGGRAAALGSRLEELAGERRSLLEEIRRVDPRFAALAQPGDVSVERLRQVLGTDAVLLEYVLDEQSPMVLAVTGRGVTARFLGVSLGELRERTRDLLAFIGRGRRTQVVEEPLLAQARALGEMLVGPVWEEVARARRIVVVPDDVLTRLPFAVLRVERNGREVWLGCAWALSRVSSAALLVEERRDGSGGRPGEGPVHIFCVPDPGESARVEYGVEALDWTVKEGAALAALFPGRAVLHGEGAATEATVRRVGSRAAILHFAVHAVVDEREPLESALLLTPGRDGEGEDGDGVLRAWEIVQDLRLDADLVTLAACDTARGDEVAGEGVMGLAWAFQYAGARAQLGSLWRVPDRSTCLLMQRFYAALNGAHEVDEALRRARSSLAGPPGGGSRAVELRHPYHWGGFTVLGDAFRRR